MCANCLCIQLRLEILLSLFTQLSANKYGGLAIYPQGLNVKYIVFMYAMFL